MTKLTDMQLILLTSAWQREDGSLLPPPESLGDKQTAIYKTIEGFIKKGFAAEKEGMTAAQTWRTDGDLTFGVVITEAGLATINPAPDAVEDTDKTDNLADHGAPPKPPRRPARGRWCSTCSSARVAQPLATSSRRRAGCHTARARR